ncbi:MAG: beta-ketoacyl-ACP synthase II [Candidatus Omnitrophica bacterium]|nr:beta-ketoacyl-ACP synthase II [Candidatus Omnitrophota bacterium]
MKRRVVVTGIGVISPVGNTTNEFWDSLIHGRSGTGRVTQVDPDKFPSKVAAEVKNFDPSMWMSPKEKKKTDRFVQFALAASEMAVKDSKIDFSKEDPQVCGVFIGSGIGGLHTIEEQHQVMLEKGPDRISPFFIPMLIVNMASGKVSIQFGLKGPNSCVATACATGAHASGDAYKIIQRGEADVMIAGGSEACITPLGFGGFAALKALSCLNDTPESASRPFDATRDGFVMGEGCGIMVLEELEHAKKRGAHIYAEIVGYGMTSDASHITAPDPKGEGGTQCMIRAMRDAGVKPEQVNYINAHGTATPMNDRVETLAIKGAFGDALARKVQISSTKSMTGHLLGAAGSIETIVCCKVIETGIIPPTINLHHPDPDCDLDYVPNQARQAKVDICLTNSLGFGGHNATLCVRKFKE